MGHLFDLFVYWSDALRYARALEEPVFTGQFKMEKPVSAPCLRNQQPIFECLKQIFHRPGSVLEIGCGTGQHAVYMAQRLPQLYWQPTDLESTVAGAAMWVNEAGLENIAQPIAFDATSSLWPSNPHHDSSLWDYVFSANTLHFIPWKSVQKLVTGSSQHMQVGGLLAVYGPFNENGFTSDGNAALDNWLKMDIHPEAGIKERAEVQAMAEQNQFELISNIEMPANNRLLVFQKME